MLRYAHSQGVTPKNMNPRIYSGRPRWKLEPGGGCGFRLIRRLPGNWIGGGCAVRRAASSLTAFEGRACVGGFGLAPTPWRKLRLARVGPRGTLLLLPQVLKGHGDQI